MAPLFMTGDKVTNRCGVHGTVCNPLGLDPPPRHPVPEEYRNMEKYLLLLPDKDSSTRFAYGWFHPYWVVSVHGTTLEQIHPDRCPDCGSGNPIATGRLCRTCGEVLADMVADAEICAGWDPTP